MLAVAGSDAVHGLVLMLTANADSVLGLPLKLTSKDLPVQMTMRQILTSKVWQAMDQHFQRILCALFPLSQHGPLELPLSRK